MISGTVLKWKHLRNYYNFDIYLDRLQEDIYPQPPDEVQQRYGEEVIETWFKDNEEIKTVLDVGCGQGQFERIFEDCGIKWTGITLGTDYDIGKSDGLNIYYGDFSFLEQFFDSTYDLIFARHSLEHSPFPVLTLMEWYRVSRDWLCVILPNPKGTISKSHVGAYKGQNHYSVMTREHFLWLAERAGWHPKLEHENDFEMRFLLKKGIPVTK